MPLGLHVGEVTWRVGSPDLLHEFFATISERLEPLGWGTRFPALLNDLYQGELAPDHVETALSELLLARRELGTPCFYTEDGKDLFDVMLAALVRLRSTDGPLLIVAA